MQLSDNIMKRFFFILFLSALTSMVWGQSVNELHLKNGSIIKGTVVEMDPSGDIKIQTSDGSLFVFPMTDVKELKTSNNSISSIKANTSYSKALNSDNNIRRNGDSFYWEYSERYLTQKDFSKYFDDDLLSTYKGAKKQYLSGSVFLLLGATCLGLSIINLAFTEHPNNDYTLEYSLAVGADAFICLGCVFRGIGKGRLNWIEKEFNYRKGLNSSLNASKPLKTLKINPSLIMTAQNDLGYGVSLNLSF